MADSSLLEKVKAAKKAGDLKREIDICIDQIIEGDAGQLQYFHPGNKIYCSSENYCPLKKSKDTPGLKECYGKELYRELISKNKKK